ncbi:MAG: DUF1800 domain-containing protein [Acetobacteraceae bacterium]
MDTRTAQALVRFGLGPRGDEAPPADPVAWLRGQLRAPAPAPTPTVTEALEAVLFDRKENPARRRTVALYRRDALATLSTALTTPAPFRERLVWFWSNHFTVSSRNVPGALIGPFVSEAIRPHVAGSFADMLLAVMRHPAMLIYLNNNVSVGPHSKVGRRTQRGLNENLARECLELHTVTPAAGYSQGDVIRFARILTGWSVTLKGDPTGFHFVPARHEPGRQTLMGRTFPEGEAGGIAALAFLAGHPATHRRLATQLARHFVADDPPPEAVRRIEGALRDTRGNLGAAAQATIGIEAAWRPATKLRAPIDYYVAAMRALDATEAPPDAPGALRLLGQPMWTAPQPNGWSDRAADWAAPEAMMRRIDVAYAVAGQASERDAAAVGANALGPLLHPATAHAIDRAGSRREALALLLSSPEFQRR